MKRTHYQAQTSRAKTAIVDRAVALYEAKRKGVKVKP
jgi:hypothetical protein